MAEKELQHLSRKTLLEMLLQEREGNVHLKQGLAEAQAALADRQIKIQKAGTMAEAALSLNGVFEATDRAVKQYLENLRHCAAGEGTTNDEREV